MSINIQNVKAVESASRANPTGLEQIAAFVEILLLVIWIGSMIFFSFAVAPGAFAIFPDERELAGRIVTNNIGKVEMLGLAIGPLLLIIQAATWKAKRASSRSNLIRPALILLMIACAALSRFWVSAKLISLRLSMGVIDNVPTSDPRRIEFNSLHQYSVTLMAVAMLAGLIVLFLTVRSWLRR